MGNHSYFRHLGENFHTLLCILKVFTNLDLEIFFIIDNIYITLTIRTNNTYNTLEYNEEIKEEYSYIHYYGLLISVISYEEVKKSNIQL